MPTTYDAVQAMTAWIATHTKYSLNPPRLKRGEDAVDQFLFEDQRGFCEQIASSLVVMSGRWRSWYCACAGALVDARPAITAAIRRRRARYMVPSANDATTNVDNLGLNDGHDSNGIRTCQQPPERCDASVALDGPTC